MNYEEIERKVKKRISKKRFLHSLGVVNCATDLAKRYNCDVEKARIAAISHDCAKEMEMEKLLLIARSHKLELDQVMLVEPQLLHGPVGSVVAKEELQIEDKEILNAIYYHTTGRENMSILEKIIYLSDVIEESRSYDGIEKVRSLSKVNLNKAILLAIDNTIHFVLSIDSLLHPNTIQARNSIILENKL